jgi:4'-phosphopantetheinyl transferase
MIAVPQPPGFTTLGWPLSPHELRLSPGEVHVLCASADVSEQRLNQLTDLLSRDERERAGRFYFRKDRDRFVARRGLLREILGRYLQLSPDWLRFSQGKNGKPGLARAVTEPAVQFNLAHSNSVVLFAITMQGDIGVDIEFIRTIPDLHELVLSVCSRREQVQWDLLTPARRLPAFFDLWTRKEAFLKGTGQGLGKPPQEIEISTRPNEREQAISVLDQGREAREWTLRSLSTGEYAITVAFKQSPARVLCWEWRR